MLLDCLAWIDTGHPPPRHGLSSLARFLPRRRLEIPNATKPRSPIRNKIVKLRSVNPKAASRRSFVNPKVAFRRSSGNSGTKGVSRTYRNKTPSPVSHNDMGSRILPPPCKPPSTAPTEVAGSSATSNAYFDSSDGNNYGLYTRSDTLLNKGKADIPKTLVCPHEQKPSGSSPADLSRVVERLK
jgi:hypothetical protein